MRLNRTICKVPITITFCSAIPTMEKYYKYFPNSDLQFGFKEKLGCSYAIIALRQCAEYFISRG